MTTNRIGYARVSTAEQNPKLQHDALERAGIIGTFADYASGSSQDWPAWQQCLEFLQPGNVLVVWKLGRVGRSTADLAPHRDGAGRERHPTASRRTRSMGVLPLRLDPVAHIPIRAGYVRPRRAVKGGP
ncbi:recombinase family protein [Arthrobacter bambusae]